MAKSIQSMLIVDAASKNPTGPLQHTPVCRAWLCVRAFSWFAMHSSGDLARRNVSTAPRNASTYGVALCQIFEREVLTLIVEMQCYRMHL